MIVFRNKGLIDLAAVRTLGVSVKEEAKAAFQKGTKEVASTLLEEFVHLKTGFADETRQLQTWLFDELLLQSEKAAGVAL